MTPPIHSKTDSSEGVHSYQWVAVQWHAPNEGWFKFNVDGSAQQLGVSAACGGVLRDACLLQTG